MLTTIVNHFMLYNYSSSYPFITLFYYVMQRKAGYIKRVAEILLKDYDSDIPSTFEELVSIMCAII